MWITTLVASAATICRVAWDKPPGYVDQMVMKSCGLLMG